MKSLETQATAIAAMVGNDRWCWTLNDGSDLVALLEVASISKDQDWDRESTRYNFADGSSITTSGCEWELEE